ncbi:MAG TPA: GNAT family N-acetyltransferase [Candidatus Elarobacter sp.]
MSASVRVATPGDVDALEPILPAFLGPPHKRERYLRALHAGDVFAAADGNAIVGFVWLTDFFGHRFVNVLAVAAERRRAGYAGMLLDFALRDAPSDRVFTSTNRSNAAMHAVLARYGWTRCGEVDELDPGDPEVFYVRRVAAAEGSEPWRRSRSSAGSRG